MNIFQKQKFIIIGLLFIINIALSTTSIIYEKYWYIFLFILALSTFMNSIYAILLFCHNLYNKLNNKNNNKEYKNNKLNNTEYNNNNLALCVPCYNETIDELNLTFDSLYKQKSLPNNKILYIICDGKNQTSENVLTIFNNSIINTYNIDLAYKTWDNIFEPLNLYCGIRNNINFIIFVKEHNKGKRDSLTLIRRLLFYYNQKTKLDNDIQSNIYNFFNKKILDVFISETNKFLINESQNNLHIFKLIENNDNVSINDDNISENNISENNISENNISDNNINSHKYIDFDNFDNIILNINNKDKDIPRIDYLFGTDADTEVDEYCIKNLLIDLVNSDDITVASVGFVDIYMKDTYFNPLKLYQFAEYYTAQLLRRKFQSTFTKKVNCLSGCNQLLKICDETCGEKILELFNKKPNVNDNIFEQILVTASEDRNHVTLMFKLFPYIKTIQTLNAKVYTKVPLNINSFISQRKRWNLGTFVNDTLILFNINHNKLERLQSLINILINSLCVFVYVSTIVFIKNIIRHPNIIMLYIAILIFIPISYHLIMPIINYRFYNKMILYYYLSYIFYLLCGPFINIGLHIYTLLKVDDFNWNVFKK